MANKKLLRLFQIIGCKKRNIEPIITVSSRSIWVNGINSDRFPHSVDLSERDPVGRKSNIDKFVKSLDKENA